ncbi:MAG TPA: sulfite exporter TauE/SafE family protein, partial [Gallionellaceae bacterium]|nr:sulfite exporter TauE/SafE family protein [Gallionellaceae bacterium]
MLIFAILAGAVTGIVLGLFGSGGSIVALPALMFLLHVEAKSAIAMSLGIVAVTATISGWDNWRRGNVDIKVATVFGLFGVIGTYAGARLGVHTPVTLQLVLFALVMYTAAWKMLQKKKQTQAHLAMAGVPNVS